jgi:predicted outer membrane protein
MFSAALAVVGAVAMCGNVFAQDTTQTTTTTTTSTMYMADANRLSVGDMIFLQDIMHANAMEIALSRIAVHHAASVGVSDYAQMMVDDHMGLQGQLSTSYGSAPWMSSWREDMHHRMRGDVGLDYYNEAGYTSGNHRHHNHDNDMANNNGYENWMYLDGSDWDKIRSIASLNGFEFDKAYIAEMVMAHRNLLGKIWKENDMTTNSDIKTLAGTIQGTVNNHLEEARRISFNYDDPFNVNRSWPWFH